MNPLQVARHRAQNRYRRIALAETAAEGPLQPRPVAARRRQRTVVEAAQCRIADAGLDIRQGDLAVAREQQPLLPLAEGQPSGRASVRERVCQYGWLSVVEV